jgi:hypothetical protein
MQKEGNRILYPLISAAIAFILLMLSLEAISQTVGNKGRVLSGGHLLIGISVGAGFAGIIGYVFKNSAAIMKRFIIGIMVFFGLLGILLVAAGI